MLGNLYLVYFRPKTRNTITAFNARINHAKAK